MSWKTSCWLAIVLADVFAQRLDELARECFDRFYTPWRMCTSLRRAEQMYSRFAHMRIPCARLGKGSWPLRCWDCFRRCEHRFREEEAEPYRSIHRTIAKMYSSVRLPSVRSVATIRNSTMALSCSQAALDQDRGLMCFHSCANRFSRYRCTITTFVTRMFCPHILLALNDHTKYLSSAPIAPCTRSSRSACVIVW